MFQKKLLCTYVTVNLIDNFYVLREGKKNVPKEARVCVFILFYILYFIFFGVLLYAVTFPVK